LSLLERVGHAKKEQLQEKLQAHEDSHHIELVKWDQLMETQREHVRQCIKPIPNY